MLPISLFFSYPVEAPRASHHRAREIPEDGCVDDKRGGGGPTRASECNTGKRCEVSPRSPPPYGEANIVLVSHASCKCSRMEKKTRPILVATY